jgi:hypothetical protein
VQEASYETEHYTSVTEGTRNTVVAIRMSTLSKGAEVKQRHYEEHHTDITQPARAKTNQKCIQEEVECSLNWGNANQQSVCNLPSFSWLPTNKNIKLHKTTILAVVLYGCETWPLI